MIISILGCGSSNGVPIIGCSCNVCSSGLKKNRRTRVAAIIHYKEKKILIDTPPDLRTQLLREGISDIDSVLYTHSHADHVNGLDDLRAINYQKKAPIPAYGTKQTLDLIKRRFPYAFWTPEAKSIWNRPCLTPKEIVDDNKDISNDKSLIIAQNYRVKTFSQAHGEANRSTSYIFNGLIAYSTDFSVLNSKILRELKGIPIWVVNCLGYTPHSSHSHLERSLEYINQVQPKLAILTHMSHELDYDTLLNETPSNVIPGFDGLRLQIQEKSNKITKLSSYF
tara:strand:- start:2 stop:844 length:843 start_codon:yes stop_codon:yes gene_type:complete